MLIFRKRFVINTTSMFIFKCFFLAKLIKLLLFFSRQFDIFTGITLTLFSCENTILSVIMNNRNEKVIVNIMFEEFEKRTDISGGNNNDV